MARALQSLVAASLFSSMMLLGSGLAFGVESLGTFRWQLSPFCNVLTLTIVTDGPIATVSGYDDVCGAAERQAVVGAAYPNPNGSVGIGLTILSAAARPSYVQILIAAGSSSGTWKDESGTSGPFIFNPDPSPKGSPRDVVLGPCPPDSVKVGPTCIDKYEASVWFVPAALSMLIQKIRLGTVTLADLRADWVPEPVQVGLEKEDLAAFGCSATGNDVGCKDIYAVSIPGVKPARWITWFQAVAAARNAGKRLPTNAEWQAAALGTPAAACNTAIDADVVATGTSVGCVSHVGALDMVGNLEEWVAEWVPRTGFFACGSWGTFSPDRQCLSIVDTLGGPPAALVRGGAFGDFSSGVFDVEARIAPSSLIDSIGFRAAR
jgi:hypothetical protein